MAMPEMRYASHLGKRNRGRAASRLAAALGVNIAQTGDFGSFDPEMLGVPSIENLSYYIKQYDDKFVYYAGTTSTVDCRGGIVFGRTATLGPVLLHGRPETGGPWSAPRFLNSFPIGTGRRISDQKLYAGYERDECSRERNAQKFAWRGESRHNLRLDDMHYARNSEFQRIEEQLGRMAAWGESELHVVLSVLAPSSRPATVSKQRV